MLLLRVVLSFQILELLLLALLNLLLPLLIGVLLLQFLLLADLLLLDSLAFQILLPVKIFLLLLLPLFDPRIHGQVFTCIHVSRGAHTRRPR